MKSLFLLFVLVLLSFSKSFPQWSTDPNNNLIIGYGQDPHICSDSAGGCYVTYDYESLSYPRKLALERIDKYGYKPWGTKKQILGELPQQWQAEIIEDGEGGVIISYLDESILGTDFTYQVKLQRVDSAGNFLWGQTGIRVTTAEANHGDQAIVSDGNGGCIVVWPQILPDYNYDYRANRINNLGEKAWGDTGIFLVNSGSSEPANIVRAIDGNYYVQISNIYRINQYGQIINQYYGNMLGQPVPDPEGGIVLSGKVWTGMIPKLVAQRKDSVGNNLWQEPYVEIADSLDIGTGLNIRQNNGYYYYGWLGRKNGIDNILQIQGLSADGAKLFNQGSIPLSNTPTSITIISIIPSNSAQNIFIWNNSIESKGTYGRIIDTTGVSNWDSIIVLLNYPALNYLNVTTDFAGGAIGVGYLNSDFGIRVFKISADGNLGEVITSIDEERSNFITQGLILEQNYPNPFNSNTVINFTIHLDSYLKIELYSVLGERIKTLTEGFYHQGKHSINFSSVNLSSGIYLYKMESVSGSLIKKLIIQK